MNNQKDIAKKAPIAETSYSAIAVSESFKKDISEIVNKSQKLLNALYLVTSYFNDAELSKQIRSAANAVSAMSFDFALSLPKQEKIDQAFFESDAHYFRILSLLSTSMYAGDLSESNFKILETEISTLRSKIADSYKGHLEHNTHQKESASADLSLVYGSDSNTEKKSHILDSTQNQETEKESNKPDNVEEKTSSDNRLALVQKHESQKVAIIKKDTTDSAYSAKKTFNLKDAYAKARLENNEVRAEQKPEPSAYFKDQKSVLENRSSLNQKSSPVKKTDSRISTIKTFLTDKPDSSINDIAANFESCSSKTIQRDLNKLIEQGQVMKKGDRRWATYSIR